jgi:hypothetical protein
MARPERSSSRIRPSSWERRDAAAASRSRRAFPEPSDPDAPLDPRRKWLAVGFATVVTLPAFWLLVAAIVAADPDNDFDAPVGVFVGIGLALLPLALFVLARMSRHGQPVRAAALGGTIAIVLAGALSFALREPLSPLVAGLGAGAVIALRAHPDTTTTARSIAVTVATAYSVAMVWFLPQLALGLSPMLPLAAVAAADGYMARRAAGR